MCVPRKKEYIYNRINIKYDEIDEENVYHATF